VVRLTRADELQDIVSECQPKLIITDPSHVATVDAVVSSASDDIKVCSLLSGY